MLLYLQVFVLFYFVIYIFLITTTTTIVEKKINREIHEAIKKISEKSVVLKNDDNDEYG